MGKESVGILNQVGGLLTRRLAGNARGQVMMRIVHEADAVVKN